MALFSIAASTRTHNSIGLVTVGATPSTLATPAAAVNLGCCDSGPLLIATAIAPGINHIRAINAASLAEALIMQPRSLAPEPWRAASTKGGRVLNVLPAGNAKRNEECGQRGSRSAGVRAPLLNAPATLLPAIPINTWRAAPGLPAFSIFGSVVTKKVTLECRVGGREGGEQAGTVGLSWLSYLLWRLQLLLASRLSLEPLSLLLWSQDATKWVICPCATCGS